MRAASYATGSAGHGARTTSRGLRALRPLARVLRRIVLAGLVALGVWSGIERWLLPAIVERQVAKAVAALGLDDARFEVREVSLGGAEITDLTVASSAVTVRRVRAEYTPRSLAAGRLTAITVDGLQLPVTLRDHTLDLGPLGKSRRSSNGGAIDLPFDTLALRASWVAAGARGRTVLLPIEGTLDRVAPSLMRFDGVCQLPGGALRASGSYDAQGGDYRVDVDARDLDVRELLGALPSDLLPVPLRAGGTLTLVASHARTRGLGSTTILPETRWRDGFFVLPDGARGPIALRGVDAMLSGELGDDGLPRTAALSLRARSATVAGEKLQGARLTLDYGGGDRAPDAACADGNPGSGRFALDLDGDGWSARIASGAVAGGLAEWRAGCPLAAGADVAIALASLHRVSTLASRRGIGIVSHDGGLRVSGHAIAALRPAHEGEPAAWSATLREGRIAIPPSDVTLPSRIALRGVSGTIALAARATPGGVTVELLPRGSRIAVARVVGPKGVRIAAAERGRTLASLRLASPVRLGLAFGDGDATWTTVAPRVALALPAAQITQGDSRVTVAAARLDLAASASARDTNARFALRLDRPRLDGSGVAIAAPELALRGTASTRGGPRIAAIASLRDGVLDAASSLHVEGISLELPIALGGARADGDGNFRVAEVRDGINRWRGELDVDGARAPLLTGHAVIAGRQLALDGALPLLGGTLRFGGELALGDRGPVGDLRARLGETEIVDERALARLVKQLKGVELSGRVALDGNLALADGRVTPRLRVALKDATLAVPARDAKAEGVTGAITLVGVQPLVTPGDQRLSVRALSLGKLTVRDLAAAFQLEAPDPATPRATPSIFVERVAGTWAGGRLYTHAVRLDPAHPRFATTLFFDGIELGALLETLAPEQATWRGALNGRLPVAVDGSRVTFGAGYLYAAPGTSELNLLDERAMESVFERADRSYAEGDVKAQLKHDVVAALRHFRLDVLRADLVRDERGLVARIQVRGVGLRDPARPSAGRVEIDRLTVNVRGFEAALSEWLSLPH